MSEICSTRGTFDLFREFLDINWESRPTITVDQYECILCIIRYIRIHVIHASEEYSIYHRYLRGIRVSIDNISDVISLFSRTTLWRCSDTTHPLVPRRSMAIICFPASPSPPPGRLSYASHNTYTVNCQPTPLLNTARQNWYRHYDILSL